MVNLHALSDFKNSSEKPLMPFYSSTISNKLKIIIDLHQLNIKKKIEFCNTVLAKIIKTYSSGRN